LKKHWSLIALLLLLPSTATAHNLQRVQTRFHYHGAVVNPGAPAEGALMNSRMANAIWDDADWPAFDADKNTSNFVATLPLYASYGLNNVTVGLQGGKTGRGSSISSGINPDGSLNSAWMARLDRVLAAAVANHMTVTVQGYYQSQDHRVIGDEAVKKSLVNIVKWLYARDYQDDVIFEVANEANPNLYSHHPILQKANVHQAITVARNARPDNLLAVTVSFVGGGLPTADVYKVADIVVLHANSRTPTELKAMVDKVRASAAYKARPVPILINEDSTSIENLNASLSKGVGWGYWDQSGFQNITDTDGPVWGINTLAKQAFFQRVKEVTN
jgi:hypothetical protein